MRDDSADYFTCQARRSTCKGKHRRWSLMRQIRPGGCEREWLHGGKRRDMATHKHRIDLLELEMGFRRWLCHERLLESLSVEQLEEYACFGRLPEPLPESLPRGKMNRAASTWTARSWIPSGEPKQSDLAKNRQNAQNPSISHLITTLEKMARGWLAGKGAYFIRQPRLRSVHIFVWASIVCGLNTRQLPGYSEFCLNIRFRLARSFGKHCPKVTALSSHRWSLQQSSIASNLPGCI